MRLLFGERAGEDFVPLRAARLAFSQTLGSLHQAKLNFALSVAIALTADASSAFGADTFQSLSFLPGGYFSSASSVSADGEFVVGISDVNGQQQAVRWTLDGGIAQSLGFFPGCGDATSYARAVNANGSVIVGASANASCHNEAFLWSASNGMVGLGTLGRSSIIEASGVNSDGSVVIGNIVGLNDGSVVEAVRWTTAGIVSLGGLPPAPGDPVFSQAFDVSSDGSVVVGRSASFSGERGFRWTPNGGMQDLGNLLPAGGGQQAWGVSSDGLVIVGTTDAYSQAFRWTEATGMVGIGEPILGGASTALAVSADGSVIVGSINPPSSIGGPQAFIWSQTIGFRKLSDYLIERGVNLDGWNLIVARDISADGSVIVGSGYDPNGRYTGWVVRLDNFLCKFTAQSDVCVIDATTPHSIAIADGGLGTDTLQLGGDTNFAFDNSRIGPSQVFRNFETFEKVGLSNVTLTGAATTGVDWDIQSGTLIASGGNAIGDASNVNVASVATFEIASNEVIGSLSGSGSLNLGSNTLTTGGGSNSTWAGSAAGTGGIIKVGPSTFAVVNAQGFTGLTDVVAGELKLNGSLAGALTVELGGKLSGGGTVFGTVTNNGNISPGNSPGTQTYLGNYTAGVGATATMEVHLNNGSAPVNGTTHDFLSIAGNVSGVTTVSLVATGSPMLTAGNGFELVRVGGAVAPTAFRLGAPMVSGGFQYSLNYLQDYSGSLDAFFLKASIRDEIFGQAAILSSSQAMTQACLRGDDRVPAADNQSSKSRGWAKFTDGSLKLGADTGMAADQDYSCGSGGVDVAVGNGFRVGAVGGYSRSKSDVTVPSGVANLMGDSGSIEGVASYFSEHSFASLSAGYSQTDWSFIGPTAASGSVMSSGLIGALQAGMAWPVENNLSIKLIGEADYDGTQCESDCLLPGTTETVSKWLAKGTVRLDGSLSDGKLLPYVALSYADDLADGNSVAMGGAAISTRTTSNLLGASGGVTARIDANTALFANVKYTGSLDQDVVGLDGSVGAKVYW
ncbi:MAG: autotransporter domain-containing protein [Micropepsaceae bacterium]